MKARTTMTIVLMGDEELVGEATRNIESVVAVIRTAGTLAIEQNDVRVEPIRRKRKEKAAE